jgi:phage major head subunit gpT-like protein
MALSLISSRSVKSYLYYELNSALDDGWVADIAGPPIPSDQTSEDYVGLGSSASLREWQGNRVAQPLRAETYTLRNQKFEGTLLVLGDERRRDKTGQVMRRVQDLRNRYAQHWMKLCSTAIQEGETDTTKLCYDGQLFFDTDHSSNGQSNQSNDLTHTGATSASSINAQDAETATWAAIEAIQAFVDDSGEPINAGVDSFTVMIAPQSGFEKAFRSAFAGNAIITGEQSGTTAAHGVSTSIAVSGYKLNLVVNPWLNAALGSGTTWDGNGKMAVFANDGRALIRQEELALQVTAKAEGSDFEHDTDMHEYGVLTSRAAGYGSWQSACLTTFS